MINDISNLLSQGIAKILVVINPKATVILSSSDQTVLPNENLTLKDGVLTCQPLGLGQSIVTIKVTEEKQVIEKEGFTVEDVYTPPVYKIVELTESKSFTIVFVRDNINPLAVDVKDPNSKAFLTFSYPVELKSLICDAFWTHYNGGLGTEEQKIETVRNQLIQFVISTVMQYVKRQADKTATEFTSKLALKVLPYVELK